MSPSPLSATAMPALDDCRLLDLPKMTDPRGHLTFIEGGDHFPFAIKRVFYLYEVPEGGSRAGHALQTCQQMIIAISGSFDVVLRDGADSRRTRLDSPARALHIAPLIWRELENFSVGAVCLVVASENYAEDGYLREFAEFKRIRSHA